MAGPDDYWAVNGDINFGYIPAGVTPMSEDRLPVRLQTGTIQGKWGQIHIANDHADWVNRLQKSVPHLVLIKLSQPGAVYDSESPGKFKIHISLNPNSLLVLTYQHNLGDPFFGVTTLYHRRGKVDGQRIGHFNGCPHAQAHLGANPLEFKLLVPPAPTIEIKKKRTWTMPTDGGMQLGAKLEAARGVAPPEAMRPPPDSGAAPDSQPAVPE